MAARKPPPTKWVSCQCIPQTACGTLSFEITGYLLHKGLDIGRFLRSADTTGASTITRTETAEQNLKV
ncbi:hypothetical protein EJB05_08983, partial [Eragrostis curvula]